MNIMLGHAKQIVLSNLHNIHKLPNIFVLTYTQQIFVWRKNWWFYKVHFSTLMVDFTDSTMNHDFHSAKFGVNYIFLASKLTILGFFMCYFSYIKWLNLNLHTYVWSWHTIHGWQNQGWHGTPNFDRSFTLLQSGEMLCPPQYYWYYPQFFWPSAISDILHKGG